MPIVDNVVNEMKLKLEELLNSEAKNFNEKNQITVDTCVYAIYQGSKVIYIGFTRRPLKIRLRELLADPRSHTLHKKLLKDFKTSRNVRSYLKTMCKFKLLGFKNEKEARALEHFATSILDPKYNY